MSLEQDKLNYIKNLIWMMCCDKDADTTEKKFLKRAAKEIDLKVDNWSVLIKGVLRDAHGKYPVSNRDRAIAALKSLMIMAKADKVVKKEEKNFLVQFAKSVGISSEEWNQVKKISDTESLFAPFKTTAKNIIVLKEDFEKIDNFKNVARQNGLGVKIVGFDEFIAAAIAAEDVVCFHVSGDRHASVDKCKALLEKCDGRVVSVLTRYQGHLVKYLHEVGLEKCIIEPVYSCDIEKTF
jgi:uncharacterized tellurite resistance protein B-like protein